MTSNRQAQYSSRTRAEKLLPYLLIAPTVAFILLFTIWPTLKAIRGSLYQPPLTVQHTETFVGLQNYIDLFIPEQSTRPDISSNFPKIVRNTLLFMLVTVGVSIPLAILFALILNQKLRWLGLWRVSLFYPAMLPLLGAASIWSFIYADNIGLANTILRYFGLPGPKWIGTPGLTLVAVMIMMVWKQSSYLMIFYLAALQGIPRNLYDSAYLDGATFWQQLVYITLPLLRRTTLFVAVIAATGTFQAVEQLQALGQGGPNETSNLVLYYIFQKFYTPRNWGYVNAMTVVLLLILLSFTLLNFFLFEGKESDEYA